jgi:hypothetical protein
MTGKAATVQLIIIREEFMIYYYYNYMGSRCICWDPSLGHHYHQ